MSPMYAAPFRVRVKKRTSSASHGSGAGSSQGQLRARVISLSLLFVAKQARHQRCKGERLSSCSFFSEGSTAMGAWSGFLCRVWLRRAPTSLHVRELFAVVLRGPLFCIHSMQFFWDVDFCRGPFRHVLHLVVLLHVVDQFRGSILGDMPPNSKC